MTKKEFDRQILKRLKTAANIDPEPVRTLLRTAQEGRLVKGTWKDGNKNCMWYPLRMPDGRMVWQSRGKKYTDDKFVELSMNVWDNPRAHHGLVITVPEIIALCKKALADVEIGTDVAV